MTIHVLAVLRQADTRLRQMHIHTRYLIDSYVLTGKLCPLTDRIAQYYQAFTNQTDAVPADEKISA
jgi:hypothetical protein